MTARLYQWAMQSYRNQYLEAQLDSKLNWKHQLTTLSTKFNNDKTFETSDKEKIMISSTKLAEHT